MPSEQKEYQCEVSRERASSVIKRKIQVLHQGIKAFEILLEKLDWDSLTPQEEECLWSFFIKVRE